MAHGKILIAGAGIGGLTAASCLMKAGYDVEVYEQAPTLTEVGAGIQLSANPMHVMADLGLAEEILKFAVRPEAYVFRLHDTGEVLQAYPLAEPHERQHGAPYCQVLRADLHDLLAERARMFKADVLHLSHRVIGVAEDEKGAELRFADGSAARGDIVVGADGIKSEVRRHLVGDTPAHYTGDAAWRLTVPADRLPDDYMDQVMSVWIGPGGHVVIYYVGGGRILNFVGLVEPEEVSEESWTLKFPWEDLKSDFEGWHDDIQMVIDAADKDQCYRWSLFSRPVIETWSSERVTLLGDAVHPTLPYLAQGAAMAIEDAAVLARALREGVTMAEGLRIYHRNRAGRTARIVRESTDNRRLYHSRSVAEIRKEFAERDLGSERNQWLYSYNPVTVDLV
ncbi:MAG: FAD-dependent monooxygenase [Alphaproteobacteria bacterium]|nr:FAD-dependent monooxygenase [Alphaproteobacteria bacterium]